MHRRSIFLSFSISVTLVILRLSILQEACSYVLGGILDRGTKSKYIEDVEVGFLTRVRRKRELDLHSYHIVEIQRPESGSTLRIHLQKSDDILAENFEFVINHGNGTRERTRYIEKENDSLLESEDHCVYSGPVTGVVGSDRQKVSGHAVLSACHENQGFSGVITTNEGQFALEPKPQNAHENFKEPSGEPEHDDESKLTLSHTLSLIVEDGSSGGEKVRKCEAIYAPNHTPLGNMDDWKLENNDGMVNFVEHNESLPMAAANPMAEKVHHRSKKISANKSSSPPFVVELGLFADESFLGMMEKKFKTKSSKVIKSYVLALAQMMAIKYQHPSLKPKVGFQITRLEFLVKNPSELSSSHGSIIPFLGSFCQYSGKLSNDNLWDHSMLLTAVDLRRDVDNAVVGVAYTGGMCTYFQSCSIIEGNSFSAASTMAHEMGHSLGMNHDGEKDNAKCDPSTNIMAAIYGLNQVAWSSCSNENLQTLLNSIDQPKLARKGNCIGGSKSKKANKSYKFSKKLPGETFSADTQCALQMATHPKAITPADAQFYRPATGGALEVDMCKRLYCTNTGKTEAFFAHPALEGTQCSPKKWCRDGECVRKP